MEVTVMDDTRLLRLQPTLEMIAEALTDSGCMCEAEGESFARHYRGVRLYAPSAAMNAEMLYIVRQEDIADFPVNTHSYISTADAPGRAAHLICQGQSPYALLEILLELFSGLQQMEMELDDMVYRRATLEELCETGAEMLGNPICIHDDWFVMIAKSRELHEVLPPDSIMSSSKDFVPQAVLEDFKFDNDYLETYAYRTAEYWNASPDTPPCLYVNLWAGTVYCGRLLVVRYHRPFRRLDYLLAEVLTQRIMVIMRRGLTEENRPLRSMDDVVYDLLTQGHSDSQEVSRLLEMLGWNKQDTMLCIRIKNQQTESTVTMEHLLHSDLFRTFPGSYILLSGHQQCVILNLARTHSSFSQLRHRLAPLCRDYCLYAGVSSPVRGIRELHLAYHQADVALNRAFQQRSDRWIIPFSDCTLDYLMNHLDSPLQRQHLVVPELYRLMDHDARKGTQYFETLRTYLLQERDIPKTSDALIIHRTTLLYRLKKIQALTELPLDNPDMRLNLLLSLWILEREQI